MKDKSKKALVKDRKAIADFLIAHGMAPAQAQAAARTGEDVTNEQVANSIKAACKDGIK